MTRPNPGTSQVDGPHAKNLRPSQIARSVNLDAFGDDSPLGVRRAFKQIPFLFYLRNFPWSQICAGRWMENGSSLPHWPFSPNCVSPCHRKGSTPADTQGAGSGQAVWSLEPRIQHGPPFQGMSSSMPPPPIGGNDPRSHGLVNE